MADQLPSPIPGPGSESSEYKLSKTVLVVGSVVTALGAVFEGLAQVGIGQHWVGIALMILGIASNLIKALGYSANRTQLKSEALQHAANERAAVIGQVSSLNDAEAVILESVKGQQ